MISERQFSNLYTSFWSAALPLAEHAVRAMNFRADRLLDPFDATVAPALNGFVNELAFRLAESCHTTGAVAVPGDKTAGLYEPTIAYIKRLPRAVVPANNAERDAATHDAAILAERLLEIIKVCHNGRSVSFRPSFMGCGVLDACEGDILLGQELWEVKSGARHFRQPDVRQVLVYCALNHAAKVRAIDRIALVNSRAGVWTGGTIKEIARAVAGCDPETLFEEIVAFVSSQDVST